MAVRVRFECGQEDRVSEEYGPFDWVQITYNTLRVAPDGEDFACTGPDGNWRILKTGEYRLGDPYWSDIIIG